MIKSFELSVVNDNGNKQIDFANHSQDFIEVVFAIDNKEVKYGNYFAPSIRGYCYPPANIRQPKPIRTMKNGDQLPFAHQGTLRAYIYSGVGEMIEEDYDVPPFIRFKLNERRFREDKENMRNLMGRSTGKRAHFKRIGNNPIEILEIPY